MGSDFWWQVVFFYIVLKRINWRNQYWSFASIAAAHVLDEFFFTQKTNWFKEMDYFLIFPTAKINLSYHWWSDIYKISNVNVKWHNTLHTRFMPSSSFAFWKFQSVMVKKVLKRVFREFLSALYNASLQAEMASMPKRDKKWSVFPCHTMSNRTRAYSEGGGKNFEKNFRELQPPAQCHCKKREKKIKN